MDAQTVTLSFVDRLPGAPFMAFFCLGLAVAVAVYCLRPWPPRRSRLSALAVLLVLCAVAALGVLRQRWVWLDLQQQEVVEQRGVPGLQSRREWPFASIAAVVVRKDPGSMEFELGLDGPEGWIGLRRTTDLESAERQAQGIGTLSQDWALLRRGYRLRTRGVAGVAQGFEADGGRSGVAVDLSPLRQFAETPGQDSPLR